MLTVRSFVNEKLYWCERFYGSRQCIRRRTWAYFGCIAIGTVALIVLERHLYASFLTRNASELALCVDNATFLGVMDNGTEQEAVFIESWVPDPGRGSSFIPAGGSFFEAIVVMVVAFVLFVVLAFMWIATLTVLYRLARYVRLAVVCVPVSAVSEATPWKILAYALTLYAIWRLVQAVSTGFDRCLTHALGPPASRHETRTHREELDLHIPLDPIQSIVCEYSKRTD